MKQFGKMPNELSVADQTKAAIWEMKNYYPTTWKALQGGGDAASKVGTLVGDYERPGNVRQATSQRLGFLKGLPLDLSGPVGGKGGADIAGIYKQPSDVIDHLQTMRDKGLITNEQCVSLATAAVGIRLGAAKEGANVHDWRRGESAEGGGLVAGTPISTFLDRQGGISNRYAGGGSGTMGAGLDHAAVFENYVRDKLGKIEGMNVEEQYSGSGGMHEHYYPFGQGRGEHNASNYSAIDVASGGHLGGKDNPLTARDNAIAIAKAEGDRAKRMAAMPEHPHSAVGGSGAPTPHIGDMSQYQTDPQFNLHIRNETGATVNRSVAMLGSANGSFNS